jgi:serine/threonine-protein kinase
MVWQPGTKIFGDLYTIKRKIREGGYGITYIAENNSKQKSSNLIVIKTLKDYILTEPTFAEFRNKYLQNFTEEAAKLAICQHPHVVKIDNHFKVNYQTQIDDLVWEGELPCIAMEYIDGQNLGDLVNQVGALSETEALIYIRQVASALQLIHDKRLLHRDIKPENIMKRAGKNEAILIDFGIAREFIPNLTQTQTDMGKTHGFAPVEQYHKRARRGEYTDIYALSATFYYLLTGEEPPAPFVRQGMGEDILTPLNDLVSGVDPKIHEAVMKGLEILPKERPQSIEEWLDMFPIPATIPSLAPPTQISVPAKYEKLQKLLAAGEWKAADQETARVMLQVAGREQERWLDIESIEKFPCEDLRTIDQLWVKYSNGRFGFSVQKNIWLECGGEADHKTECKLGDRIGWRVRGEWILYDKGTFSMKAPYGHIPIIASRKTSSARIPIFPLISSLAFRAVSCNI